jgi:hypothetical protein
MADIYDLTDLDRDELEDHAEEIIEGTGEYTIPLSIDILHNKIGFPTANKAREHFLISADLIADEGLIGKEELGAYIVDHCVGATIFLQNETPDMATAIIGGTSAELNIRPHMHSEDSITQAREKLAILLAGMYAKIDVKAVPQRR